MRGCATLFPALAELAWGVLQVHCRILKISYKGHYRNSCQGPGKGQVSALQTAWGRHVWSIQVAGASAGFLSSSLELIRYSQSVSLFLEAADHSRIHKREVHP